MWGLPVAQRIIFNLSVPPSHTKSLGTQDVVLIESGSYVVLRTHLADFTGYPVVHCHLLFHEDFGMMSSLHINRHASAGLCRRNYAQARADCERNHPMNAPLYRTCRQVRRHDAMEFFPFSPRSTVNPSKDARVCPPV